VVETEGFSATEQGIDDDGLFEFARHVMFSGVEIRGESRECCKDVGYGRPPV
jgi:hypothetical protein